MKSEFSSLWKSSTQPRKQRKYLANAPLHLRKKLVSAHLSKELRAQHKKRSIAIRKGDEVKVMRGSKKGIKAKISEVNLKDLVVYLEGQLRNKVSGKKAPIPFQPSNLMVTGLNLDDKKREAMLSKSKVNPKVK